MRLTIAFFLALAFPFTFLAQSTTPPREGRVTREYDRFKDSTTVTLDALLSGEYPFGLSVRAIQTFSGESPAKEPEKLIFAFISGGAELEYEILHDLIFLADGERLRVDNSSYLKQAGRSGYVELVLTAIPVQTLRKVASASKAEAQLGKTEFELTERQKESLRAFLAAVTPGAALKPEAAAPSSAATESEPERPSVTRSVQEYLRLNFGTPGYETSWYGSIKGLSVRGSAVDVQTDRSEADMRARGICSGVSGFVFSNENRSLGLSGVRVYGNQGQLLIHRRSVADPCR